MALSVNYVRKTQYTVSEQNKHVLDTYMASQ